MDKFFKAIAAGTTFSLLFYCLGCGVGNVQDLALATPAISQVSPQTITAGSQTTTLKVSGINFPAKAAILWNGAPLTTTVVDANTLSGTIGSGSLTTPATVQLKVQNTQTMQESQAVPVVIAPDSVTLAISTTSLPQGTVTAAYTTTLGASGGTSPYTWSITSGQLPAGLMLAANTGVISGTPTVSGAYPISVTATDSSSPAQTATAALTLSINAAPNTPAPLVVNTSSLPSGTVGSGYLTLLQASGGSAPYSWSIASGNLPAGLNLTANTGIISGVPSAAGTSTFTAAVADAAKPGQTRSVTLSLSVAPVSLAITTSSLPSGTIGAGYGALLQAGGGTAPYTWSITTGSLPAGLTLSPSNGIIFGIPTTAGTFSFTTTATDSGNPAQTRSANLSIVIAPTTLSIASSALPSGTQGAAYSRTLRAFGGTAPYTWSLSSGALPAGLTLAANGVVSGTPTASGNFSIGVTVKDAGTPAQTATATGVTLSIVASGTPLAISSTALPGATTNQSYFATLNATGGTGPYAWSISTGSLPAGLTLVPATGIISGTPTASGTAGFTATVTDAENPAQTKSVTLSIAVTATSLTLSTSSVPSATKGTAYSALLNANGGTNPYAWSITAGALPAGLTLGTTTGLISGTPTTTGTATFTATVTDAGNPAQTKSVALSIVVTAPIPRPLTISTSSLPAATKGARYSSLLQAGGGTPPYSWSVTTGSLPAGISLAAATGAISGTPTATGTSSFTVTVTDAGNPAQTKQVALSIVVAAGTSSALTITATLPSGIVGTSYSSSVSASGGTPAYTYSISGTLPGGLTLAATTGVISGTPTATGTFNFTATVTDNSNPVQTKSVATSIVVAPASLPTGPGTTWYVRADGGTRYSASQTLGQCDGKSDAAYPGSGTNQHCAFNDVRYLWTDGTNTFNPQTNFPAWGWIGSGGDTYIIRGGPWRIGQNGPNNNQGFGLQGDPYDAGIPAPLKGTSGQHTRILGENFGACTTSNQTQLFGGYGVGFALDLRGAQFVDVECIDLTRHSQCIKYGSPAIPAPCNTQYPLDDYATTGILTNTSTHDVLLQDMYIHGFISRGINGPIGGAVSATRVDIAYNGAAGWDFDDGNATPNVNGVINLSYVTIEWNGCNQAYPGTGAVSCYSQSTGGYGDGIGTPSGTCLTSHVDHTIFRYNTQDGFDMLHNDTGSCSLNVTDSMSYGNNGQQFKWGPADNPAVFTNNVAIGNCNRLSKPMPGQPSTYNANLSDFCRAQDTIVPGLPPGGSLTMENNTIVSYAPTIVDFECSTSNCSTSTFTFKNNIMIGYDNPATYGDGSQVGGPGAFFFSAPVNGIRSNNIYYGMGHGFTCPSNYSGDGTGTAELCTNPMLINQPTGNGGNFVETELDNFNFDITPGSPAVGAGLFLPGLTVDYTGATRGNPPSIGAYEK
ncbi:MAG: Ig domain-containing protein [Edaphobacter sp.]